MKRILLFFALFIAIPSFAQIEEEILQSSKSAKIAQGRDYLVEKFLDRDYDKVKEIKDYLLSLEDDDYVALTPYELWHILAWTKEFDALTASMRQMDSAYLCGFRNKILPEDDMMMRKLYLKGCEDEHLIRFNLQEAQLQPEDEAVVSLALDWLLQKSGDEQDELNEKSTRFLKDYPDSDYEWFVRHLIRNVTVQSDKGWGMGIDVCSALTTGMLHKPIAGIGMSFDIYRKKWDVNIAFDALAAKTKADQQYGWGGAYPKGKHCDYLSLGVIVARNVYESEHFNVLPFLGVSVMEEYYAWANNHELKDLIKDFCVCHAGCFIDIPFLQGAEVVRFKYDFGLTGFGGKYQLSQMHFFSVNWNVVIRDKKRVF